MTKINSIPNGPYKVTGEVEIFDTKGKRLETKKDGDVYLCRCGNSRNKPFCDGSHARTGFIDG